MQSRNSSLQGGHSFLYRFCAFVGGPYFSLLLLIMELTTIALSIGIAIVYGPFGPTPSPAAYSTDPWVWFSPANSSHVAVTVRLFGTSESLFICTSLPTSASPCSASAVQSISIPVATDGSGLFKTIIGGLSQGTRYYWQVGSVFRTSHLSLCSLNFARLGRAPLAHFSPRLLQEQISNLRLRLAPHPIRILS